MSLEPQTTAKARIRTTKGPIDIELWANETPITSRHFLENVLNQRFNGCEFNRIIPGFIIQLGDSKDPSEKLDIAPQFKDEFNSRLKFNKRGLIGSVNKNKRDTNIGKFFITLKDTNELNNKNTMFGKVVGDGIFNVLKISEGELDGETPVYPVKVLGSEVLIPYFDDLVKEEKVEPKKETKTKKLGTKKRKVKLNLDDEEKEDNGDTLEVKMQSVHDVLKKKSKSDKHDNLEVKAEKKENDYTEQVSEIGSKAGNGGELPQTKNERNAETQELLKSFESKIKDNSIKKSDVELKNSTTEEISVLSKQLDDYDEDFDNLDVDSDDGVDIFSHSLKFSENTDNSKHEDPLITIDPKRKRSSEGSHQKEEISSLSKKSATT